MQRFYFSPQEKKGDRALLDPEESHHLLKVLRLSPGEKVTAFDGEGNEYHAQIGEKTSKGVYLEKLASLAVSRESPLKVTLIQGVAKGDKMDFIVQKATELGVNRIIPVVTRRTVVKLSPDKAAERQERWQKIAKEAAKQSRRTIIPIVEPVVTWDKAMETWNSDQMLLIPWEGPGEELDDLTAKEARSLRKGLKTVLTDNSRAKISQIGLAIGPEGGIDSLEIEKAIAYKAQLIHLGPRILRTETAGLAALAALYYELGDWN